MLLGRGQVCERPGFVRDEVCVPFVCAPGRGLGDQCVCECVCVRDRERGEGTEAAAWEEQEEREHT